LFKEKEAQGGRPEKAPDFSLKAGQGWFLIIKTGPVGGGKIQRSFRACRTASSKLEKWEKPSQKGWAAKERGGGFWIGRRKKGGELKISLAGEKVCDM